MASLRGRAATLGGLIALGIAYAPAAGATQPATTGTTRPPAVTAPPAPEPPAPEPPAPDPSHQPPGHHDDDWDWDHDWDCPDEPTEPPVEPPPTPPTEEPEPPTEPPVEPPPTPPTEEPEVPEEEQPALPAPVAPSGPSGPAAGSETSGGEQAAGTGDTPVDAATDPVVLTPTFPAAGAAEQTLGLTDALPLGEASPLQLSGADPDDAAELAAAALMLGTGMGLGAGLVAACWAATRVSTRRP